MIGWLIETMFAVTLLMLLVLAVRRPVAHLFGAGWAYALWLLPILRIILPPLHLFGGTIPSLPMPVPAVVPAGAAAAPLASAGSLDWEPLMLAVWLGGSALVLLWQGWSYFSFARRLGIGSRLHAPLAQDIGIMESPEVEGPLAIGLLDRWIVVPVDFTTRYTPQEQRLALLHERTHHRRQDIFCNMVALGVLALNWFNPIAYFAFRAFRADQELSCDAVVAARASGEERHDYALALVKSSSKPGLIAACPLNHAAQLKQRLRMMKAHRATRFRAFGGLSAVTIVFLAGISATETASVAAPAPLPPVTPLKSVATLPPALPRLATQVPTAATRTVAPRRKAGAKVVREPAAPSLLPERVAIAPEALTASTEQPALSAAPSPIRVFFLRTPAGVPRYAALPTTGIRELRMVRVESSVPAEVRERLEAILARKIHVDGALPIHTIELKEAEGEFR